MTTELWLYFVLYAVILPIFGILYGRREGRIDWFHPITASAVLLLFTIGFRIFYILSVDNRLVDSTEILESGLRLLTIFFLISAVLFRYMKRLVSGPPRFTERQKTDGWFVAINFSYLCLGLLLVYMLISKYGGIEQVFADMTGFMSTGFESNWLLVMGYKICQNAAFAFCLWWMLKPSSIKAALVVAVIPICMLVGLSSGFRSFFFIIILYCLCGWNMARRRIGVLPIAAFIILILLATPILNMIRFENRGSEVLTTGRVSSLTDDFSVEAWDLITSVSSRFIALDAHCRALDMLTSGRVEVENGRRFWEYPLALVPRRWYPDKPDSSGVVMTDVFFSDVYHAGTGTVMSMPLFLFWQFGWTGIVVSPLIFSLLLAWVVNFYDRSDRRFAHIFVYTTVFFEAVVGLWMFDLSGVTHLLFSVILIIPLIALSRGAAGRNRTASP